MQVHIKKATITLQETGTSVDRVAVFIQHEDGHILPKSIITKDVTFYTVDAIDEILENSERIWNILRGWYIDKDFRMHLFTMFKHKKIFINGTAYRVDVLEEIKFLRQHHKKLLDLGMFNHIISSYEDSLKENDKNDN